MGETEQTFDVIVVGGGPVGLTLAASLLRFAPGIALALVDRRPLGVPPDARASAIAAGVTRVFEALGLWERMAADAAPVRRMAITDSGAGDVSRPLLLGFEGDVLPGRPYAHMVPNRVIAEVLNAAVAGATVIAPVEVAGFEPGPARAALRLADGRRLTAPLIVAADGARSGLREMAGIGVIRHDYGQSGIVTTISHARDHEQTAWEHFLPAGPFASLPLPGRRSSLVWTETTAEAARLAALPPDELALAIEAAMGSVLGAVTVEDQVQTFPLSLQIARDLAAPRLALVGDAAHVVHPIAGQGLNLGLKDVAALSEVAVEAMRLGLDHGGADVLARYRGWRRLDTALMGAVTDGMNRLFSNDVAPVRALRDLGLGVVDRLPGLKSAMIRQAAGVGGNAPKLMEGLPL